MKRLILFVCVVLCLNALEAQADGRLLDTCTTQFIASNSHTHLKTGSGKVYFITVIADSSVTNHAWAAVLDTKPWANSKSGSGEAGAEFVSKGTCRIDLTLVTAYTSDTIVFTKSVGFEENIFVTTHGASAIVGYE